HGTLTNLGDGSFTYMPNAGFSGTDSFIYEIWDSVSLGDTATVTITVEPVNNPPDCSGAEPSIDTIWPPDHKFVSIEVLGVTDPDGDEVTITIDSIYQDEPVDTWGDGNFTPDGRGVRSSTAQVRAERAGAKKDLEDDRLLGNGRVYHILFTANDGPGGACSGTVRVGVPVDQGKREAPVDDGPLYDSTALAP
ncbi:MAG: cadherin-like domain-containing protein, partial [Anaerolineales bacterium]